MGRVLSKFGGENWRPSVLGPVQLLELTVVFSRAAWAAYFRNPSGWHNSEEWGKMEEEREGDRSPPQLRSRESNFSSVVASMHAPPAVLTHRIRRIVVKLLMANHKTSDRLSRW